MGNRISLTSYHNQGFRMRRQKHSDVVYLVPKHLIASGNVCDRDLYHSDEGPVTSYQLNNGLGIIRTCAVENFLNVDVENDAHMLVPVDENAATLNLGRFRGGVDRYWKKLDLSFLKLIDIKKYYFIVDAHDLGNMVGLVKNLNPIKHLFHNVSIDGGVWFNMLANTISPLSAFNKFKLHTPTSLDSRFIVDPSGSFADVAVGRFDNIEWETPEPTDMDSLEYQIEYKLLQASLELAKTVPNRLNQSILKSIEEDLRQDPNLRVYTDIHTYSQLRLWLSVKDGVLSIVNEPTPTQSKFDKGSFYHNDATVEYVATVGIDNRNRIMDITLLTSNVTNLGLLFNNDQVEVLAIDSSTDFKDKLGGDKYQILIIDGKYVSIAHYPTCDVKPEDNISPVSFHEFIIIEAVNVIKEHILHNTTNNIGTFS